MERRREHSQRKGSFTCSIPRGAMDIEFKLALIRDCSACPGRLVLGEKDGDGRLRHGDQHRICRSDGIAQGGRAEDLALARYHWRPT